MDSIPKSVGTGREDALSRADDLAERAASTRAIGQLSLAQRTAVQAELQAVADAALDSGMLPDPLPDPQIEMATGLLTWLRRLAGHYLDVWPPVVAVSGEFVFELWRGPRKLTLYVEADGAVSVLRVWGDHIDDDMDEPPYVPATRGDLLRWLETGEGMPIRSEGVRRANEPTDARDQG